MKTEKWIQKYGEHFERAYLNARAKLPFAPLSDIVIGVQSAVYTFASLPVVIKISRVNPGESFKSWAPDYGKRPFDCPIFSQKTIETPSGILIVSIAPKVEIFRGNSAEFERFTDTIHNTGYELSDWRPGQAGLLNGRPVLVDYECAHK